MATNQTGVQIIIKAWLPVTGSISEQIAKLQMVETAHTTGDYAELLKAASVEDIKAEQKTRRIDDAPAATTQPPAQEGDGEGEPGLSVGETEGPPASSASTGETEPSSPDSGLAASFEAVEPAGTIGGAEITGNDEPEVPEFIKNDKKKRTAA